MKKHLFILSLMILSLFVERADAAPEVKQNIVDFLKPKLNSDRIEYFFGNYGVDILNVESPIFSNSRITNLYSVHQGKKIMRTLAVVDFLDPIHPDLYEAHHKIKEGESIGIALREHGFRIHKIPMCFGSVFLSPSLMDWMDEHYIDRTVLHVYRLEISKNDKSDLIPYCNILEVHSPQYLTNEWLQALYSDQYQEFSITSNDVLDLLSRLSILIQNFPFPYKQL